MVKIPFKKSQKIRPSLESIVVKGRFTVPSSNLEGLRALVRKNFIGSGGKEEWRVTEGKNFFELTINPESYAGRLKLGRGAKWFDALSNIRAGVPVWLNLLVVSRQQFESTVDVMCRPCMYFKITQAHELEYEGHVVQEAQIECSRFASQLVIGCLEGKEIIPLSVGPSIRRGEIGNKLDNLGLKEITECLDGSEKHLAEQNYDTCLHKSRTAFEKMVRYVMARRKLGETDKISNDIDRLKRDFLGDDTGELLKHYYHFLSDVGTHESGTKPTSFEAQLGYGFTLVCLEYMLNKL